MTRPSGFEGYRRPDGRVGVRNHVLVVQLPHAQAIETRDNFAWMTLAQLRALSQGESRVNSEARTLLACLPLYT